MKPTQTQIEFSKSIHPIAFLTFYHRHHFCHLYLLHFGILISVFTSRTLQKLHLMGLFCLITSYEMKIFHHSDGKHSINIAKISGSSNSVSNLNATN